MTYTHKDSDLSPFTDEYTQEIGRCMGKREIEAQNALECENEEPKCEFYFERD